MAGRRGRQGQSLVEFALVLPLLFLLIVNVVNFGGLIYAWITVANAARSGAQYTGLGPASAGGPVLPGPSAVTAMVRADLSVLPNNSDPKVTVSVCSNNKSTGTAHAQSPQSCLPPNDPATGSSFADPEPGTSVVGTVEVNYVYCPLIPLWEYPALRLHSTLPACNFSSGQIQTGGTNIRRVAVMRILQ